MSRAKAQRRKDRSPSRGALCGLVMLWTSVAGGAARADEARPAPAPAPAAAVSRETASGPVKAVVSVSPAKPALGDPISLTLEVTAEPGVDVRMPAFGEALGRFEVVDFAPREGRSPAGGTVASQRYTLEAPMSGKQTIPPLLVEFVDRRSGQPGAAGPADVHELLTEEITIDVASALAEGASAALRPARGPLDEAWPPPMPASRKALAALAAAAVVGAVLARRAWLRAAALRARRTAFDIASARLAAIEARGTPRPEAADAWYVELSAVVRRYVEDRYGLRAPELTTEEFFLALRAPGAAGLVAAPGLAPAGGEGAFLAPAHGKLLRTFLERCDRVKFAAYTPGDAESREALEIARRFLEETREGAPVMTGRVGAGEEGAAA